MPMRFGFVWLALGLSLSLTSAVFAHLADEFPQVTLQIEIDDEAVEMVVGIPAKDAKHDVFDGMSPVAMDQMQPEELSALVGQVFAERCPVMIDAVMVPPTVLGAVVQMKNSRLSARSFPEPQVLKQGTLKFLARYETKGSLNSVSIDWSIFANEYDEADKPIHADEGLQVVGMVQERGREQIMLLTPSEPGYTWHSDEVFVLPADLLTARPLQRDITIIPASSIVTWLLGAAGAIWLSWLKRPGVKRTLVISLIIGLISLPFGQIRIENTPLEKDLRDKQALAIFEILHRNIYRAFDYTEEGAVYDALAQSVDGPMLETIYNDVYQSLIMREENGAVSKVVRVEIEDVFLIEPIDELTEITLGSSAYVVHCTWQVDGLVTHFGHSHARTNAFAAVYTVAPQDAGWRIVDSQIIDQQRIDDGNQTAEDLLTKP